MVDQDDPRIEALRRIDMEYVRRDLSDPDSEYYMKVECDCQALLMEKRPVGISNRDNLNLLDVVEAAMAHRHECAHAQPAVQP
jgi:hypothetical protein